MKLLVAKGATSAHGRTFDVSWDQFCQMARDHSIARSDETENEKKSAPWFSTVHYRDSHRRRENIIGNPWAVVLDIDSIREPEAVEKSLARWEYVGWTTWKSKPDALRWRIVIPIKSGVAAEKFGPLVKRIVAPIQKKAKVDSRSFLPEQLWFLPWHKRSQTKNHQVWTNEGNWIQDGELIHVDFTGVKLATKPEEIGEGDRNNSLVLRLQEPDALRTESEAELVEIAREWNDQLQSPMANKEVRDTVRKKWKWLQRGEGLALRVVAWRSKMASIDLPDVGTGLTSDSIKTAKIPRSIIGDFLFPGATMITAKMKEGKSFLAMQLALSAASGVKFLNGSKFEGFDIKRTSSAVIIAGEDTKGDISSRFLGSIAAGHLPSLVNSDDVKLIFNDDLDQVRRGAPAKMPGLALFEALVERWYKEGYRIIAVDPLRVLEAALGVAEYPGFVHGMNPHSRDFLTMRYYTKLAQAYSDLSIIVSMHHGKNKKGQDADDPGDLIAGTTGYGAGAITTIALLPAPDQLQAEADNDGFIAKRRQLYIHGRHTREKRVLVEQDSKTGVWQALGLVEDEVTGAARKQYFDALLALNGNEQWISAEAIAKKVGRTQTGTVHKVLNRARRDGETYLGWRLVIKRGLNGGYRLTTGMIKENHR